MKKLILSAAMLIAVGFTAKAQDKTATTGFRYGVKAGLNLASLTNSPSDANSRVSFHAGVVAEFKIAQNFSIQPELLYSEQGLKYDFEDSGIRYKSTWKFNYLNLPVLAKYYVMEGLSIEAGPQIGYRLSAKIKAKADGVGSGVVDMKDSTKAIDFGLAGGVAYDLPIGVFFQARYIAGISKVNDDNDGKVKNGVFQVSVGYKF